MPHVTPLKASAWSRLNTPAGVQGQAGDQRPHLGGDLLLCCQYHALVRPDANDSARVGDGFHRVLHLVQSSFRTEDRRAGVIAPRHARKVPEESQRRIQNGTALMCALAVNKWCARDRRVKQGWTGCTDSHYLWQWVFGNSSRTAVENSRGAEHDRFQRTPTALQRGTLIVVTKWM